jgi:hypothetical protein
LQKKGYSKANRQYQPREYLRCKLPGLKGRNICIAIDSWFHQVVLTRAGFTRWNPIGSAQNLCNAVFEALQVPSVPRLGFRTADALLGEVM